MSDNNTFKGMTERDLLIQLNERVAQLQSAMGDSAKRLDELETDFRSFKIEMQTRLKMYLAIASTLATAIGSILTKFINF